MKKKTKQKIDQEMKWLRISLHAILFSCLLVVLYAAPYLIEVSDVASMNNEAHSLAGFFLTICSGMLMFLIEEKIR
jgi:hypothetical protein